MLNWNFLDCISNCRKVKQVLKNLDTRFKIQIHSKENTNNNNIYIYKKKKNLIPERSTCNMFEAWSPKPKTEAAR